MTTNSAIITQFIIAWSEMDLEKLLDFFSDDAIYTNIPIDPPNVGKEQIRATIAHFMGMAQGVEFVVHFQGESPEGHVFNERTDRFNINGEWLELPVMGIFELENGKITAWRDYFDMQQFTSKMAGA